MEPRRDRPVRVNLMALALLIADHPLVQGRANAETVRYVLAALGSEMRRHPTRIGTVVDTLFTRAGTNGAKRAGA